MATDWIHSNTGLCNLNIAIFLYQAKEVIIKEALANYILINLPMQY